MRQRASTGTRVAPAGAKALFGVHHYVTHNTNLPEELIHLVFLRVIADQRLRTLYRPAHPRSAEDHGSRQGRSGPGMGRGAVSFSPNSTARRWPGPRR